MNNDLDTRLKKFLELNTDRRSVSDDSEELTEKIDVLLKEYNGYQSFESHANSNHKSIRAPAKVQVMNLKIINQIKLMIKPPEQLIMLSAALVQLFGGCMAQICTSPFTMHQVPAWSEVKTCLQNPVELLKSINDFQTLLQHGRIKKDNIQISTSLMNHELCLIESQDRLSLKLSLMDCLKKLHAQAQQHLKVHGGQRQPLHHQYINTSMDRSRRSTSNGVLKRHHLATKKKSIEKSSTPKKSFKRDSYVHSLSRSCSHDTPKRNDLLNRVQLANQKKIGRLDRILQLQVRKPHAESSVKYLRQGRSNVRSPSQKDPASRQRLALQEELDSNLASIRHLKHQEMEIKWRVQREVKHIQNQEEQRQQKDQLHRSRVEHDLTEQQAIQRKLAHLHEKRQNSNATRRSPNHHNQIESEASSQDNIKLESLKSEYLITQRYKAELETSLQKMIHKMNQHSLSDHSINIK